MEVVIIRNSKINKIEENLIKLTECVNQLCTQVDRRNSENQYINHQRKYHKTPNRQINQHQIQQNSENHRSVGAVDQRQLEQPQANEGVQRINHRWTRDGRPIYSHCGTPGHIFRNCRQRQNGAPPLN